MRSSSYLYLATFATLVSSSVLPVNERCVTSIYTAYTYINFDGPFSRKSLASQCQNPLEVTSIYASTSVFCDAIERSAGLAQLETMCKDAGFDLIPREQLAQNLTQDAISRMRAVDFQELSPTQPVDFPVLLSPSHYGRVFRTLDTWAYESWTHYAYGYAGYLYWACILLVGMLSRAVRHFFYLKYDRPSQRSRLWRHLPFGRVYHWIRTNLLVPTVIPPHGREFLCWTFPNRIEAIVTLGFWVLSTVLCAVSYRVFPDNIYWPDTSTQLLRYIADRTGIISFANLPLLWLFAGRNNICAWATGWNFATFNIFHRHVAWIAIIQAVVHTLLYLVLFFRNSDPWRKLRKAYILWGTLGTVLMVLILPAAVNWFRHRAYETFLFIHIIFSVGLLVACFYHTIIFEGQEYWFYLWLPVGIWTLDRFLRIVRVVYCNIHVRTTPETRISGTTSTATYNKAADLIRLEVVPGSSSLQLCPGQYYFLYQPFRLTGWESHPFTLGSWSYDLGRGCKTLTPGARKSSEEVDVVQMPLLSDGSSSLGSKPDELQLSHNTPRDLKLTFWIRPYDGWTRHLRDQCLKSPDRTSTVTVLLEGPYGPEFPLWNYDSVLLVAGGTGIASAVPYIRDHITRSATAPDEENIRTSIQNMHLIWVARQPAFIEQLASNELSTALERDDFHASFYATSPLARWERNREGSDTSSNIPTTTDKDIDIMNGRPNLKKLISAFAEEAHNSDSSAAVLICGPQKMADEARAVVYKALQQGYSLQYVEESFTW
ncbi:ferric reductase like transmembrane component-domain-containing protein [Aspergillus egyptiacus]|nr:ferric reductase like transmembrane component-domain-containing protein [Aspergillus egyptiacus]